MSISALGFSLRCPVPYAVPLLRAHAMLGCLSCPVCRVHFVLDCPHSSCCRVHFVLIARTRPDVAAQVRERLTQAEADSRKSGMAHGSQDAAVGQDKNKERDELSKMAIEMERISIQLVSRGVAVSAQGQTPGTSCFCEHATQPWALNSRFREAGCALVSTC